MPERDPAGAPEDGPERRSRRLLAVGALALAAAACAGPERSEAPLSEEVYVEVMARLSAVRSASLPARAERPLSEARADSIRRRVLREHGVRRSELELFARIVGDEPKRMEALWERIAAAADSLREADWPPAGRADSSEPASADSARESVP